jgi:hypothetical protein
MSDLAAINYFYSDIKSKSTHAKTDTGMSYTMAKAWRFESWMRGFIFMPGREE